MSSNSGYPPVRPRHGTGPYRAGGGGGGWRDGARPDRTGSLPPSTVAPAPSTAPPRSSAARARLSALFAGLSAALARPVSTGIARLRAGRRAAHQLTRDRRQVLAALGGGAAVLGSLGASSALLGAVGAGADRRHRPGSPRAAGAFSDRDASYVYGAGGSNDLGAGGLADTPSQAAAAALRATPKQPTPLRRDPVLHLLRRATFGPTAAGVATVRGIGLDAWIEQQLSPTAIADPMADQALAAFPTLNLSIAQLRATNTDNTYQPMYELGRATIARQLWSARQLYEVMVDFWSNHLNVTNPFDGGADNRGPYDRDVIRAHALGRFSDMLHASARHPAMLRYLDNAVSDKRSVNENYGRELLELHTVGIDSGYTETDVRNSAYLMTGRTVDRNGMFTYDPRRHWTGPVKALAFTHANRSAAEGLAVGDAFLGYLAAHPATATGIARKLAVRFVCDAPPDALVQRLAKSYLDSGTAIVPVLKTLLRSLEFWIATGLKTRRPLENLVATGRALGVAPGPDTAKAMDELYRTSYRLGNAPLNWSAPNGYPDVAGAWTSADAMLETWNVHRALVQGFHRGLTYLKPDQLLARQPQTVGEYVDALADRLVFQPLTEAERTALLAYLPAAASAKVRDAALGGRFAGIASLVLDSIYHALR